MKTLAFAALMLAGLALRASAAPVDIEIVGPEGAPIAEAQIVLHDFAEKKTTLEKSDATGHLAADLSPIKDGRLGSMEVYATGYGIRYITLREAQTRVKLEPQKFVAGEVRNAQGQAVEGARVRISNVASDGVQYLVPDEFAAEFSARTGSDGSWTIGGLPAQGRAYATLDDAAYAYETIEAKIGANLISEAPPLTAKPGASIAGRVLDEAGQGVAGIEVSTSRVVELLTSWVNSEATSGADGSYRIDSLPAGTYTVVVKDAQNGRVALGQQKLQLKTGQLADNRDFQLKNALFIEGTIQDEATGAALAGVEVTSYGPNSPRGVPSNVRSVTDANGRYRVPTLAGTSRLYVDAPRGYYRRNFDIEVQPGQNTTADLKLRQGVALAGTTVDANGQPMGRVFLFVEVRSPLVGPDERAAGGLGVTSDAQGRWQIEGLAPGEVTIQPSARWDIIAPPGELPQTVLNAGGEITFDVFQMKFQVPRSSPVEVPVRALGQRKK